MSLYRYTQVPPPPEPGEKTFWDYFPKRAMRRVFFMLLALAAVIYLKTSGTGSFGGLFDDRAAHPPAQGAGPVYHIQVKPTPNAPEPKSTP
jgi:hypothetical protein